MTDGSKTKAELKTELESLRQQIADLQTMEGEHKKTEGKLRESEAHYKAVVENVADAIVINVGTRRVFVNKAFLTLHGLRDMSQASGMPIDNFVVPEDRPLVRERTLARQRGETMHGVYEYRIRKTDGKVRTVETSAVPITYGGQPAALAVLRDITHHKLTDEALLRANLKLEQANRNLEDRVLQRTLDLENSNKQLLDAQEQLIRTERLSAIGQLSGSVAHDLRNPLGAINNAVYYLKRKLNGSEVVRSNPRVAQFLQIMEDEVSHSNQIITDLMNFARVNAPCISITNLQEVVDTALSRLELADNVRVVKQFDPDLLEVPADAEQLQRVFMNLIMNAHDAMPEGGELTISSRRADGFAELAFSDTGVGISDEDMKKIFDPLFTTKTKGTGLGLAICREIVSKHGGTIDVSSKQGEGSTFRVCVSLNGHRPEADRHVTSYA